MAFAAALVLGWVADNETSEILKRAIFALVGCWMIGWGVGAVAQRAVQDRIDEYKRQNPIEMEEAKAEGEQDSPQAEADAEEIITSPTRGS